MGDGSLIVKRSIIIFLVGGLLGTAAGFALGIFVYPYLFLADIVAADKVEDKAARKIVATGMFIHANPRDPIHYGKGKLAVYQDLVHLEADFEVGPGPKFHVYLVPEANVVPSTNVARTMFVDLGRLKAFKGSQNYPVPAGVDLRKYGSVVIWCEQFGVLISPAALKFQ
jgi:ABC-type antimicrobial peptide transport system permease subunit